VHQTKKDSNLGKGTKIVASIERPCQEAKSEHMFSWTNYREDPNLKNTLTGGATWFFKVIQNMPLPITIDFYNHFFGRSSSMDYWNHFYKKNKLVFSFIQFIYKWKFIHFSNTKHAITRCKVFVNGVGKCLLFLFQQM